MDITINGNVNINFNDQHLLDNESTFKDLISLLKQKPQALESTKQEEMEDTPLEKAARRPGANQLRDHCDRIAMIPVGDGCCEVFSNGYALFDNGDRKTVVWVPDCGERTYYFTQLTDKERTYQHEKESLDEDVLGDMPWYYPVIIAGEDSIEWNLQHPRSTGTASDVYPLEKEQGTKAYHWSCGAHFPNPEEEYIRKETEAERRAMLTDKQLEVYDMYYDDQLTQAEIAEILGVSIMAVNYRLEGIKKKAKKFSGIL